MILSSRDSLRKKHFSKIFKLSNPRTVSTSSPLFFLLWLFFLFEFCSYISPQSSYNLWIDWDYSFDHRTVSSNQKPQSKGYRLGRKGQCIFYCSLSTPTIHRLPCTRCRFKRRSYSVVLPENVLQQKLPKALLSQMKIRRDTQGITNLQLMQKLGICLVLWRSQERLSPNHGNRHTQMLFWLLNMNILVTLNTDYSCFSDCISKWEFFCSFFTILSKIPPVLSSLPYLQLCCMMVQ